MKSNLFGLFCIFLTMEDVYSEGIEVMVGEKINLCCRLSYAKEDGLTISHGQDRLKILFKDRVNDIDIAKFREKNPDFDVEQINGTLCLVKQAAALTDHDFKIMCRVNKEGMYATLAEQEWTLQVYEELKFEIKPPEILNGSIGESKSIECRASGSPKLEVIWRAENQGRITSGSPVATLEIKDITAAMNQFKYTCEASTAIPKMRPGGVITQTMTLNVYFKPEMNIEMLVVHTELGDTENVTITVKGNPSPTLDCQLLDIKADRIVTISNPDPFVYVWSMIIFNVTQKHIGNYKCMASNSQGSVTKEVLLSLKPANLQITSENKTSYSNYYLLTWTINSKSLLKNTSISLQVDEAGNWSVDRHLVLSEKELATKQTQSGSQRDNWKKTFNYNLFNLTSERQYKISLKACNKHECIDSTNTAIFKTPISDDKNTFDANKYIQSLAAGNGGRNTKIRSSLLFVVTQITTLFFISVALQQLY